MPSATLRSLQQLFYEILPPISVWALLIIQRSA
jgi:hypothetical protein